MFDLRTVELLFIFALFVNRTTKNKEIMPYRRLPNTDSARMRALETAYNKSMVVAPVKLAYSPKTYQALKYFLPTFKQVLSLQRQAFQNQISKSGLFTEYQRKAKLYISHFIQVLNLAIIREEISESARVFYGLQDFEKKLPPLSCDQEILAWGEKIIEGENRRMMQGGTPIFNPRIALVKIHYDHYKEAQRNQVFLKNNNNRALEKIAELRPEADKIILDIWNEVEATFENMPAEERRRKAQEYGLSYVFRKTEKVAQVQE